jgi:hypothetical protein
MVLETKPAEGHMETTLAIGKRSDCLENVRFFVLDITIHQFGVDFSL